MEEYWGPFLLLEKLYAGTQSEVLKVCCRFQCDKVVVLKKPSRKCIASKECLGRFMQERERALSCAHPNVIRAVGAGCHGDTPYYMTAFIRGLAGRATRFKRLELVLSSIDNRSNRVYVALNIINQVAEGVKYLHQLMPGRELINFDLGLHNIIVDRDCHVTILDLGNLVAKGSRRSAIRSWTAFHPPEAYLEGVDLDEGIEVFGLGAMLGLLITGQSIVSPVWKESRLSGLRMVLPTRPPSDGSTVLDRVMQIVSSACNPSPALRYRNVDALQQAITDELVVLGDRKREALDLFRVVADHFLLKT